MKNTTWKLLRSVLLSSACISAVPALADQSMTYTVKTVIVKAVSTMPVPKSLEPANTPAKEKGILLPLTKGKSENKTTTETKTDERKILLGRDQIIVESKEGTHIIDFAKKRMITIDPIKHEYTEQELYVNIFFRQAESQNRKMLNGLTASAGIKQIFDPFDTEMLFSVVVPGAAHDNNSVKTEQVDGKINYVHKGTTVASYEPSTSALLQSDKRGFTRYLAYNCSLHPEIRSSIVSQKMLPEKLVFQFQDGPMAKTDCTYTLKSAEEVKVEETLPPADYKLMQDKELSGIYAALAKYGADPKPIAQSAVSAAVDVDLKNNNPLNAMLTVVEYSLSSGDQRPQDIARVVAQSNGNADYLLFSKNLEPHSEAAAKTAVKALESINSTKLSKGYVIDIMEANIYMQLRDLPKAKMLFKRALVTNPLNVGALHDLGNLYIAMWAPHTAWECFRLARKIDPTHPIMRDIDELEHKLQRDFPDYF